MRPCLENKDKKPEEGTGEKARGLNIFAVLPEYLSSVPSTHTRQLTAVCKSSCRGPSASGLCKQLHTHVCTACKPTPYT